MKIYNTFLDTFGERYFSVLLGEDEYRMYSDLQEIIDEESEEPDNDELTEEAIEEIVDEEEKKKLEAEKRKKELLKGLSILSLLGAAEVLS